MSFKTAAKYTYTTSHHQLQLFSTQTKQTFFLLTKQNLDLKTWHLHKSTSRSYTRVLKPTQLNSPFHPYCFTCICFADTFQKIQVEGFHLFESLKKNCTTLFQRYVVPKGSLSQGFPFPRVNESMDPFSKGMQGQTLFQRFKILLSLPQGYFSHKVVLRPLACQPFILPFFKSILS